MYHNFFTISKNLVGIDLVGIDILALLTEYNCKY